MATGAHDFVRPPPPSTPHSSSIRFPRGLAGRSVETRAEPRCDACGRTFQTGPTTQVRTVRKRGTERTALAFQRSAQVGIGTTYNGMRPFGGRRRVGIGTYTTLAPLDEPKRWQLGPTILFDRPRPAPPTPPPSDFPVGWPAALWRREQSRGAMRAGELFKPGPQAKCGR